LLAENKFNIDWVERQPFWAKYRKKSKIKSPKILKFNILGL
jgi:hypothetical protein